MTVTRRKSNSYESRTPAGEDAHQQGRQIQAQAVPRPNADASRYPESGPAGSADPILTVASDPEGPGALIR